MEKKLVEFKVTAPASMRYWLAVDEADVSIANGVGSLDISAGEEHMLVWWMVGKAEDALAVDAKVGGVELFKVKESKIPKGQTKSAGRKRFTP